MKNWQESNSILKYKGFVVFVGFISAFLFWIYCFLLCLWLMLTWEDLASFWVYSFSICFSLLLACKTHVHEHTQWPVSLVSLPHAYHQALGWVPAAPPFWAARKPQGSPLIWCQLFITEEASKKKDLSCQLLDKHKTSVDRKKKGEGETEIDTASVTAQR